MKKLFILLFIMISFSVMSFGQAGSVKASASARATIVVPLTISKSVDLDFGTIAAQSSLGGTVVLTPTGSRTVTGGAQIVGIGGRTGSAASFTVTGLAGSTYSITLPSTVTVSDGTNTMAVSSFTSTPSGTGSLSADGTIKVGATLTVAAGQTPGDYTTAKAGGSGDFDVIIIYN